METSLKGWVESWDNCGNTLEVLTVEQWYTRGHEYVLQKRVGTVMDWPELKPGFFLWFPLPSLEEVSLEKIRKSHQKKQHYTHIILTPKLCSSPLWQKIFYKCAIFYVPSGSPPWPYHHHEHLCVAILFPFIRNKPWKLKGTPKMIGLGWKLCRMWKEKHLDQRAVLCKFWMEVRGFQNMPEHVVSRVLYFR